MQNRQQAQQLIRNSLIISLQLTPLAAIARTAVVCVTGPPDNSMLVPLCTSTRVTAAHQGYSCIILKASNIWLSVLRGQALGCAAVANLLQGMRAGTALLGHKAVSITIIAGTHKQLMQAEHRPAEKQHMCARLLSQHSLNASKAQMLGNASAFAPIKNNTFTAQCFLSDP